MLRVMFQKIWHKKWMVFSLLLGCILLSATAVSFPMYKESAFNRILQEEFNNYLADNGEWPGFLEATIVSKKDAGGKTVARMEDWIRSISSEMGVTDKEIIMHYGLTEAKAFSTMKRDDVGEISIRPGMMSGLDGHAEMLAGQMYSETGIAEDGSFEVVVSQSCMVKNKLLVGETVEFEALKNAAGEKVRLKIVGVYGAADENDFFWQVTPEEMDTLCLMNEEVFYNNFLGENAGRYTITCRYYYMFEHGDKKASDVKRMRDYTTYLMEESPYRTVIKAPKYVEILDTFEKKQLRIEATLFILQVPSLVLLCAFLFMIASQMYDMERNEISVYKSRGSSRMQIFGLYLYQSIFITLLGTAIGLPLGALFCRILGSAKNFLEFDLATAMEVTYTKEVWEYAALAALVAILFMTVPAIKHSRLTIVKLKQQKAMKKKSLWQKCFLDFICLGVGIYGYYSFSKNREVLVVDVLQGESMDPLLYISSSLFIVGLGLLFLRIQPLLIKLIYTIGKPFWGAASYASFMENMKNGGKQQFIMLFMILTVSLGMFHATVARTILQNAQANAEYLNGADIILKERWSDNSAMAAQNPGMEVQYFEPAYTKYASLSGAQGYTKVIFDEKASTKRNKNDINVTLMGIHTKEFGENTQIKNGLLEKHYYEYLNELAVAPNGVLVSRNFQSLLEYNVGDSITYKTGEGKSITGKIIDFFDYWPGYEPTTTILSADGTIVTRDNYCMVANYETLKQKQGVTPYEVWINLKEETDSAQVASWIEENEVHVTKYVDKQAEMDAVLSDPLLRGTNGVLTMGFIVILILCAVGYLIYWIMSIRSREMMFGVLRASGMHKDEVLHMLLNEQIFSGVFSIFAGIVIGKLASGMFVPMLQTAYAAANQVLPMELITNPADMTRLYTVVAGVMVVCLAVLIFIVFKMNVAKALKLGED